jgi:DNA-binding transcriptional ArsR family regulator
MSNITEKQVDMLLPFTNKYSGKLSATELARENKLPQQTVSRHMNNLAKNNLIEYETKGKNKLFYFNLKKQTTKIILKIIENKKALRFQIKLKKISIIIDELTTVCESLIIFGSYASMSFNKDSDMDIIVLGKYNKEEINKIKQRQSIKVNEHYISYSEFSNLLNKRNTLSIEILKNHIIFGNVSKISEIFRKFSRNLFI